MAVGWNPRSEFLREPNLLVPGKKPVGSVKIDWGHSLANGLKHCYLLGNSPRITNLVTGEAVSLNGSYVSDVYQGERALKFDGSTNYIDIGTYTTRNFSYFGRQLFTDLSADRAFLGCNNTNPRFQFWMDNFSTDRFGIAIFNTSYQVTYATTPTPATDQWYSIAGRVTSNSAKAFINGIERITDASLTTRDESTNTMQIGAADSTQAKKHHGYISVFLFWDRVLTDIELVDISADPYQFLIPA